MHNKLVASLYIMACIYSSDGTQALMRHQARLQQVRAALMDTQEAPGTPAAGQSSDDGYSRGTRHTGSRSEHQARVQQVRAALMDTHEAPGTQHVQQALRHTGRSSQSLTC